MVSNQLAKIAKELVRVGQLAKELVRVGGFIRGFALAHSNAEMSGSPDISGDDVSQGDERVMTIIFVMTRSSFDTCGTRSSFDTCGTRSYRSLFQKSPIKETIFISFISLSKSPTRTH